jgi:hypothetical protein
MIITLSADCKASRLAKDTSTNNRYLGRGLIV